MSYAATGAAANHEPFRRRVEACLFKLAQDVLNEAPDTAAADSTDAAGQPIDASFNRAARRGLADEVLARSSTAVRQFAFLCAANGQINSAITLDSDGSPDIDESAGHADDGAIEFVCASNWDNVARWRMSSVEA